MENISVLSKKKSLMPHELQSIINWWKRDGNFNLELYTRIRNLKSELK